MEYCDERDLNVYTDGSSYQGPRRGGVGILYVVVDESGLERADAYPLPGYAGATNNEIELLAAIEALRALATRRAPVTASAFRKVVIWTDSTYLVEGYDTARFTWHSTGWMTRAGNPVANAELWKDLLRVAGRLPKPVEIKWVKGHKTSAHNKAADKLAKRSASLQPGRRASVVGIRRKKTKQSVELGSVAMRGQRLTIRIITDQYLRTQRLNKYKYEVISKASEYHGNVDVIYSPEDLVMRRGHTYYVRVNTNQDAPRVLKRFREIT